jgi:hypothetical protein
MAATSNIKIDRAGRPRASKLASSDRDVIISGDRAEIDDASAMRGPGCVLARV